MEQNRALTTTAFGISLLSRHWPAIPAFHWPIDNIPALRQKIRVIRYFWEENLTHQLDGGAGPGFVVGSEFIAKFEEPFASDEGGEFELEGVVARLVFAAPSEVGLKMAGPEGRESELEAAEEGVASIGDGGVEKLRDGALDLHDEVVAVGFAPVVPASMAEFDADRKIFTGGPIGADIAKIEKGLLEVVGDGAVEGDRGTKKIAGEIGFRKGAVEDGIAEKSVGVEVKCKVGEEAVVAGGEEGLA